MGKMKKQVEGQVPDVGGAQNLRGKNSMGMGKSSKMGKSMGMGMGMSSKMGQGKNKPWNLVKNNGGCHCTRSVQMGDQVEGTFSSLQACKSQIKSCDNKSHGRKDKGMGMGSSNDWILVKDKAGQCHCTQHPAKGETEQDHFSTFAACQASVSKCTQKMGNPGMGMMGHKRRRMK